MNLHFRRAIVAAVLGAALAAGCGDEDVTSVIPDDIFEPNDSIQQFIDGKNNPLADMTGFSGSSLVSRHGQTANVTVLDSVDFFKLTTDFSGTLVVTCTFTAAVGDIDISLWDETAFEVLGTTVVPDAGGKTLSLSFVTAPTVYYVRIALASGEGNTYDLMW
ncbi:MAG: hypothetical protein ACYSU0_18735, partial [Planctomycetota bacterium]